MQDFSEGIWNSNHMHCDMLEIITPVKNLYKKYLTKRILEFYVILQLSIILLFSIEFFLAFKFSSIKSNTDHTNI